jgi:hypothetical protein
VGCSKPTKPLKPTSRQKRKPGQGRVGAIKLLGRWRDPGFLLKEEHRMGRNYFAHTSGSAINTALAAGRYNFRHLITEAFVARNRDGCRGPSLNWPEPFFTNSG